MFPVIIREKRRWTLKGAPIRLLCDSFDSILANLSPGDLSRLSARPVDVRAVTASRVFREHKWGDSCSFKVELITAVGWLDVMDVTITCLSGAEVEKQASDCSTTMSVTLASTGFLPLSLPGATLFNVILFWVPFLSVEQTQRLDFFRDKLCALHALESEEMLCRL